MTGRSIVRTRRPGGTKPLRDAILHDADKALLYTHILADSRRHARKLCGLLPYSLTEVKPCDSAAVIYRLLAMVGELQDCRSVARFRELQQLNRELLIERDVIKREMQRWGLSMPCTRQGELFNGEG